MQFTVTSAGSVPAGNYTAKFVGVEAYEENVEAYGEGVLLRFEITSGDLQGQQATRICSKKFSSKSNLYLFAKAIAGRELEVGESFSFDDHVGSVGMLIVADRDNGTRVETFLRTDG